ncbi:MAG: L-histidine N(alpha)-methyltransferase [Flavobacteriales bacterium]|nr:L-histidine N(alpha)-methyltransferase [Flavobacteriales bacterium]MBT5132128.1 L-histidine N(alpha)-methyltransferase [Flavobacteriales bacterium]MBT6133394.1 L-histidine N(alpha)-methyltransferase [Flavobacteriales bacterium]
MIEILNKEFADDVHSGLTSSQKSLNSRWFYDERGDQIFVDIMNMPEYYLTNCEHEIFCDQTEKLIQVLDIDETHFDLYELGAGDGTKTMELLRAINGADFTYHPIDISFHAIHNLEQRVQNELPEVDVRGIQDDYFSALGKMQSDNRKVILFMGSNIGNMDDEKAHKFMCKLSETMSRGDVLLLGVDLMKPGHIVLPAYNDASGHTAAFNLNLLERINRELDGNFDLDKFIHRPVYEEDTGFAKSFLQSKEKQTVRIEALDLSVDFEERETIFMEISRKYNDSILRGVIQDTGLQITNKLTDSKGYFADYILKKV